MRSLTVLLIAAISLLCFYVSGDDVPPHPPVYDRVIECITLGTHADPPSTKKPVETLICDAFKAMYPCLINPFSSPGSTEVLNFYRAYQLQRIFLANKDNLCKEPLPYLDLKKLVDESGVIKKEHLTSIENDTYVSCAGKINIKCFTASIKAWKTHSNYLQVFLKFIKCYAKKTPKCDFPIAQHMNAFVQAFKKHLYANHGLLAKLIKGIKPPVPTTVPQRKCICRR